MDLKRTFQFGLEKYINRLKDQHCNLCDSLQLELETWGLELGDLVLISGYVNVVMYHNLRLKDEVCLLELRDVGSSRRSRGLEDFLFLPDLEDTEYIKVTWQQVLDQGGIWEKFKHAS